MKFAVGFALGVIVCFVALAVIACCRVSGDLQKKTERWSDDEL